MSLKLLDQIHAGPRRAVSAVDASMTAVPQIGIGSLAHSGVQPLENDGVS
jgi:hypothetical protein